jgi:hypothetical protein
MEMAAKSVVKNHIPYIFISNRFRTKHSLHIRRATENQLTTKD